MKHRRIAVLLVGLIFSGGTRIFAAGRAQSRYQENRAKAIVFRELLKGASSSNAPFFLAVSRGKRMVNPSPQVMKWVGYAKFVKGGARLEDSCREVRRHNKADGMGFVASDLCVIHGLKWISKNRIDVDGSSKEPTPQAAGH